MYRSRLLSAICSCSGARALQVKLLTDLDGVEPPRVVLLTVQAPISGAQHPSPAEAPYAALHRVSVTVLRFSWF